MSQAERIFNNRPRKVFRKRIPSGEAVFGACFLGFVVVMGGWFAAQQDAYDPTERDISMDLMVAGTVQDKLYRTPLQRWVDPAHAVAGAAQGIPLGIFPAALLDGGWQPSSRLQEFVESNLYEKINGAAPQYVAFGFERLHYISIERGGGELDIGIEFYDMGLFQNALGIFAAQRDESKPVERLGKAYYYLTEAGSLGIIDRFYFKLAANTGGPEVDAKCLQIIEGFNTSGELGAELPLTFSILNDALGIPFDGIVYEKSDVFQFSFAKDFWFGQPARDSDLRYFVHQDPDAATSRELYEKMRSSYGFDYDVVEESDGRAVLKHKFLGTFMTLVRRDALIYGVEGAAEDGALKKALTALEEALPHGQEA